MNAESQWTVYRTRFLVRARQLTEPVAFTDALGREQSGQPGDYLVEFSDGIKRITNQALFEDIYVPLEGSQSVPAQHQSMEKKLSARGVPGALAQSVSPGSVEARNRASA
ncbi:MAG TPA: hypothetical protein VK828_05815 [Terriglobales bacterium]|jgi:hypothetical protein|nr:hypothetical protein [Terriglobales bacterium]